MLSIRKYGGTVEYALPVLTAEAARTLQAWYDNQKSPEFAHPLLPTNRAEAPRKLGSLYWPLIGASRFASGSFVIDYYTLGLLRTALGTTNKVELLYRDEPDPESAGTETARAIPLYLLSSRPVSQTELAAPPVNAPDTDDLWIINLVDRRWYWALQTGGGYATTYQPTGWTDLYGKLSAAVLDGPISYSSPNATYLTPSDNWIGWKVAKKSTALLLDLAARQTGSRVVVTPTAAAIQTPSQTNFDTATTWFDDQIADASGSRFAGGGMLVGTDVMDHLQSLPKTVTTQWRDKTVETTTISTGLAGNTSVYADLDLPSTATTGQRTAALAQWASDWQSWQYAHIHAIYDGFVLPPTSGFLGGFEIHHDGLVGYTRINKPAEEYTIRDDSLQSEPDFFARLTTSSGGLWKFVPIKKDGTTESDDGIETADYVASPITYDGTHYPSTAVTGMRVWMHRGPKQFEFMPIGRITPSGSDDGTAYGYGWLQGLQSTDCLQLIVLGATGKCNTIDTSQVIQLVYSAGTWTSAGQTPSTFAYDGGSGTVVLGQTNGIWYLTINGIYLTPDGAGIVDGVAYVDFAGGVVDALCSTGTPASACGLGNIFRVRIVCTTCTVTSSCCANPVPTVLTATFSNGTTDYTSLNGTTVTITYGTSPSAAWRGTFTFSGVNYTLTMSCGIGPVWNVSMDRTSPACGGLSIAPVASGTCGVGTTSLVATGVTAPSGCGKTGSVDVTITG